jgi:predicted phosphodiesterase
MNRRRVLHWAGATALSVLLVIGGVILGWRLAQESHDETRIGRVALEVNPALRGGIEAFVPVAAWGVRVDAFDAPFRLRAELRSLNRGALLRAAEGDREILEVTERQLRDAATTALVRAGIWGTAVTLILLVLATFLWRDLRPRWALLAIGSAVLVALTGATVLRAHATLDSSSFNRPTYFAQGDEISRILDLAGDSRVTSGYGSEFASIVRSISTVLAVDGGQRPPGVEMYAGSDLHGNALVVGPIADIVGDLPLLLVGDFGQRGNEAEAALLAPRVAALGRRVIAVSGNHDSVRLMQRLADEGVTVLGERGRLSREGVYEPPPVIDIDGVGVAGYRDPLEYAGEDPLAPDRPVTASGFDDPAAEVRRWRRNLIVWFRGLRGSPDVVMIHQNGLAEWLAERLWRRGYRDPLTIVTGHNHRQHIERFGSVVVVNGGTMGAGGIFGAGVESIGLAHLMFNRSGDLRTADLIAVEPFSGAAQATRIVVDTLCPDEPRCRIEPPSYQAPDE